MCGRSGTDRQEAGYNFTPESGTEISRACYLVHKNIVHLDPFSAPASCACEFALLAVIDPIPLYVYLHMYVCTSVRPPLQIIVKGLLVSKFQVMCLFKKLVSSICYLVGYGSTPYSQNGPRAK